MKRHADQRRLARLAVVIHAALSSPPVAGEVDNLPSWAWERCQRDLRRLHHAQQRQWHHAESSVQTDLRASLERLGEEVRCQVARLQPDATSPPLSANEVLHDLLALHEEFCDVDWDQKHHTLAVTTAPVTLEGRYLGAFRIELDTNQLQPQPFYSVVAEDPQPAAHNCEVTHPHILGDQLCEGEGTMPIRAAMREGRILDFFLIINNLLHNYNSSSPYVSLDAWDGVRCSECDYQTSEDNACSCDHCETDLCCDCSRCCRDCSNRTCYECSSVCGSCDESVCRNCVKICCDCDESFCSSCFQDDERCESCHEDFQEEAESQSTTDLQSVCVGEVAVLA